MLAFVDPLAEMDRPAVTNPMMPSPSGDQASSLNELMIPWGLSVRPGFVLGDSRAALSVGGPDGSPVRHLAIVGMGAENLSAEDVVTADLESVNFASAGIIDIASDSSVQFETLIQSSDASMPLDASQFQYLTNPADLLKSFVASGERYAIAARVSGSVDSAFPDGIDGYDGEVVSATDSLNVILVADSDLLSDRLWVQVQNFFGQQVASPWANNGDLVINSLDNLSGSSALISIRSRGRFTRPFDVVQDLQREAEAGYLESAEDLQAQLAETEIKLSEMQSTQESGNVLSLTAEQEAALIEFQNEKLRIRKQLRDVRHQLNQDIEELGSTLKFLNIALIPLLLTLGLLVFNFLRISRDVSR